MLKKLLVYISIFLFLLAIAITVASFYYEGPVKRYIMKEVNKRLESPVNVSGISFSVWEKFPYASVVFEDVWAHENLVKIGKPDTLFFLKKVYFQFNLVDLWDGSYHIRKIAADDGFIRMSVDEKGYDNYHFWKKSEDTTGFLLALEDVEFNGVEYSYRNLYRDQDIRFYVDELQFSGEFSSSSYSMEVAGEGMAREFRLRGTNYLRSRKLKLDTELFIEQEKESYRFRQGDVLIDDGLRFLVAGAFVGNGIDLQVKGVDLDIIKALQLLPAETARIFEGYESSGTIEFDATIKGAFDRKESPHVAFSFGIQNGTIGKEGTDYVLRNLNTRGTLDNGSSQSLSSTVLKVDTLDGMLGNTEIRGAFSIANFHKPAIEAELNAKGGIEEILGFFNIKAIEIESGTVDLSAKLSTILQNPDSIVASDFLNANASGRITIQDAAFGFSGDPRQYFMETGSFEIRDNDLRILNANGRLNACEVELEGNIDHFLSFWFVPDSKMHIRGKISAGGLTQNDLFSAAEGDGKNALGLPQRFTYDLEMQAESFRWNSFEAKEISGHLVLDNFQIKASSLHFLSQGGNVQGSIGLYRFSENQFGLRSDFSVSNINVRELFSTFNNFNQEVVRTEHLLGTASADIAVQLLCDSFFSIDPKSISAEASVKITEGELIGFEPLLSVGEYIRNQKMLRLFIATQELQKRLEHVKFSTLANEITISNGRVTIPRMEIRSSAIDMNIAGTHSFDQEINYSLDFALSELLTLKGRTEPLNEFVGRDQKGKTVIYMSVTGTSQDPVVQLERTNVKQNMQAEIEKEKQEVKGILKDEFGVFQKDTSVVAPKKEKQDVIRVEWEEGKEENKASDPVKKQAPVKKKSFINRLMEKTEADKKDLQEGEFEDEDF